MKFMYERAYNRSCASQAISFSLGRDDVAAAVRNGWVVAFFKAEGERARR